MKYSLLIYVAETVYAQMTPEEQSANMVAYNAFSAEAGPYMKGGEPLLPTSSATTVRLRNGQSLVTDGPFAETKEQLAGFYVVDCANIDEAIALAAKIPDAKVGSIEIRPVMVME